MIHWYISIAPSVLPHATNILTIFTIIQEPIFKLFIPTGYNTLPYLPNYHRYNNNNENNDNGIDTQPTEIGLLLDGNITDDTSNETQRLCYIITTMDQ